jgi:hypothetical protein
MNNLTFRRAVSAFLLQTATTSPISVGVKFSSRATEAGSWRKMQKSVTWTVMKAAMVYSSAGKYIFWHRPVM